jgi:hypothetical protein
MMVKRLSVFLICLVASLAIGGESAPPEVRKAASLEKVIKVIKPLFSDNIAEYGFNDTDKIENISVGEPFRIYYIGSNELRDISTRKTKTVIDLKKNIANYPWIAIVYVNGEAKFFAEIVSYNGVWGIGTFGYDPNALALHNLLSVYPPQQIELFKDPGFDEYYFHRPSISKNNFTILNAKSLASFHKNIEPSQILNAIGPTSDAAETIKKILNKMDKREQELNLHGGVK